MSEYVFFDVETPNRRNDRICSIGVVRTDMYGHELYSREVLVNPETGFDDVCMNIHHIAPIDVKRESVFADIWNTELASVFSDATLVAHNASFDMSVLEKTMTAYDLPKPSFDHVCTYSLARRNIPNLSDYRLPTVARHFDVDMGVHHDALDDASACDGIFWSMMNQWGPETCYALPYVWADFAKTEHLPENCSQALTDLYSIFVGLSMSGSIDSEELVGITDWMDRNRANSRSPFFRQAYETLKTILADGAVSGSERDEILSFTRPFVMNEHNKYETVAMQQLIGIMRGISADGVITKRELIMLQDWLEDHADLGRDKSFLLITDNVKKVLEDGRIDADEEQHLLSVFGKTINPIATASSVSEGVVFEGRLFVLSGKFSVGPKSVVEEYIRERGGEVIGRVSGKIAYVVIGGEECEQYAFGNYGTKAKQAMELQESGKPIQIIQEMQLGM